MNWGHQQQSSIAQCALCHASYYMGTSHYCYQNIPNYYPPSNTIELNQIIQKLDKIVEILESLKKG